MKITGILGYPLEHSFSPELFNSCYKKLDLDYIYLPFAIPPQDLKAAISGLKALGARGVNVTIPHKEKVIEFLDELDETAQAIGAVNTIVFGKEGAKGYNTDQPAFLQALEEEGKIKALKELSALLIGAGGGGRAAAFSLLKEEIKQLDIFNRNLERGKLLAKLWQEKFPRTKIQSFRLSDQTAWLFALKGADLIINATPVGMYPEVNQAPVEFPEISLAGKLVFDLIYNPPKTHFLKMAEQRGAKIINGLLMLIYQGQKAFELWTGVKAPLALMKWVAWESQKN